MFIITIFTSEFFIAFIPRGNILEYTKYRYLDLFITNVKCVLAIISKMMPLPIQKKIGYAYLFLTNSSVIVKEFTLYVCNSKHYFKH